MISGQSSPYVRIITAFWLRMLDFTAVINTDGALAQKRAAYVDVDLAWGLKEVDILWHGERQILCFRGPSSVS